MGRPSARGLLPAKLTQSAVPRAWDDLPLAALDTIVYSLEGSDIEYASLVSKAWRMAALAVRVSKLRVLLDGIGLQETSGRGSGRARELLKLLQQTIRLVDLHFIYSFSRQPTAPQLQAALTALQQHSRFRSVHLEFHACSIAGGSRFLNKTDSSTVMGIINQTCAVLQARSRAITRFKISIGNLAPSHLGTLSRTLAGLHGLQQLSLHSTYEIPLKDIACSLTNLTSLSVDDSPWCNLWPLSPSQQILELLAPLSSLASLHLKSRQHLKPAVTAPVLPAWPHLTSLHLDLGEDNHINLLLSAQHCAQLQGLTVPQFHAAPGVTSLDKLQSMELHFPPTPFERGADDANDPVWRQPWAAAQQLQYPLLQHVAFSGGYGSPYWQSEGNEFQHTLQYALSLIKQAPCLVSMDLLDLPDVSHEEAHEDIRRISAAQQQGVYELLTKPVPLRSLKLPFGLLPESLWPYTISDRVAQALMQQQELQHLASYTPLPSSCNLSALKGLRELHLRQAAASTLAALPQQLTGLTMAYIKGLELDVPLQLPPLRSLSAYALSDLTLSLSQLTTLTQLDLRPPSHSWTFDKGSAAAWLSGGISSLTALVHLACMPWLGMAAELAPLKHLRKLTLYKRLHAFEQQVQQFQSLTQLKEISLPSDWATYGPRELPHQVQQLEAALPDCLITTDDLH